MAEAPTSDGEKLALLREALALLVVGFDVEWIKDETGRLIGVQAKIRIP